MEEDRVRPIGDMRVGFYIELVPQEDGSIAPMIGNIVLDIDAWASIEYGVRKFFEERKDNGQEM